MIPSDTVTVPVAANRVLSDADTVFYRREGYLIARGVFSADEMDRLAEDVERVCRERADLIDAHNMRVRFQNHHATNEPLLEVFDPISDLSPAAQALTCDRRILDRLHDLYGEPAELFKDKFIWKPAGALGATLHQDWIAWPGFPRVVPNCRGGDRPIHRRQRGDRGRAPLPCARLAVGPGRPVP